MYLASWDLGRLLWCILCNGLSKKRGMITEDMIYGIMPAVKIVVHARKRFVIVRIMRESLTIRIGFVSGIN